MMKDLITTVIGIMTASFSLLGQTDAIYIRNMSNSSLDLQAMDMPEHCR